MMLQISICLSDLPKNKMRMSEDGKKAYIDLVVGNRRDPDKWGNDLFVALSKTKEEREAKAATVYVGKGKELFKTAQQTMPHTAHEGLNNNAIDDLPF